uniref:UDP-galactose transporter n=1 Tax=Anisakis simplex TaxID=6269 RepID=A0A0M3JA48_ANISI
LLPQITDQRASWIRQILKLLFSRFSKIIGEFMVQFKAAIWDNPMETAKICVPAVIYTFQNNLYYIALSHLEAATVCLVYQFKIFTTAILLCVMLKKRLTKQQWLALVLMAIGVANVQLQYEPPKSTNRIQQYPAIGFLCVISMCFTSAFAGDDVNIWMQNIRLSLISIPISAVSV